MSRIRLLDDLLISQIAAGEVVERPASVVKELVENALDAGATSIEVELEAGGKRRIVVADDGVGMDSEDALLAFDRHATSKIAGHADLERVATLGFRGEALAAIAGVARVELQTAEEPGAGQRVRIEGGRVLRAEPFAFRRGSRIEVASLFFNVPARRKFLKSPETELRRCLEVVQGYALAHPEKRFVVAHEGKVLLEALPVTSDEGARRRIGQVYGRDLAEGLLEIPLDYVGDEEAIAGFIGDRASAKARRSAIFVNRRLIKDRVVTARFYRAVRSEWHADDYPSLFLFLEVPPDQVDVNVHPQKLEVRFRSEALLDRIEEALRRTLAGGRREERAPLTSPRQPLWMPSSWEGLGGSHPARTPGSPQIEAGGEVRQAAMAWSSPPAFPGLELPSIAKPTFVLPEPRTIALSTSPLSGRGKVLTSFRILGQYKGSLVLLEGPDGLYLVDQHAAHERVLYERFRRDLAQRTPVRRLLLEPVLIELAGSEALRLQEAGASLETCGFEVAALSGGTLALRAVPEPFGIDQAVTLLRRLAIGEGDADVLAIERQLVDELAADRSCKAAIKIHRVMPSDEMEALVSALFACEQPYACPHGRPTILHLGDADLERRFGRRG